MSSQPIAVITGSSSGIGRATALELARSGYAVLLHGCSNLSGTQAVATEISVAAQSQPVRCIMADFSHEHVRRDFVQAAFSWYGRVDVWVNLAGVDILTTDLRHSNFEQKLQALMNIDVTATIDISRRAAAGMKHPVAPHGSAATPLIVNVGWDQAELGMEGEAGQLFGTTKAAVMAFSRSLALSVAPQVRVNCVAPGWIQTAWGSDSASPAWDQRARTEALLERWGSPEDVATAIRWLASKEAAFVNAQTIQINGGRRYYPRP